MPVQGESPHVERGTVGGADIAQHVIECQQDKIKSCNAQRDTNSFAGYGQQQKQPGQGDPEAIPSQILETAVLNH